VYGGNEQWVDIKFCFKAGLSATETLVLVQKAYVTEALNRSNVFIWYSRIRDGREPVENDERGGRPKSNRTEVNIATVADLAKNDRRIASRMITESLNIPKTIVLRIWKRIWEREICVHVLCHTPWHLSKGEIESHLAKIFFANGRFRQNFFLTKLLWEMRPGVLPRVPIQSYRVLSGLVRRPLWRRNLISKGLPSRSCW
jgi:hypothetical protein